MSAIRDASGFDMELALIFALSLVGLVLAGTLFRARGAMDANPGVQRVAAAVARASRAFGLQAVARGVGLAVVGGVVLAAGGSVSGRPLAGFAGAMGALLGALLAAGATLVAQAAGNRTTSAVVALSQSRFDAALAAGLRGSGAAGVASQALAVLGALPIFFLTEKFGPGTELGEVAVQVSGALAGYALGAALVATTLARASSVYAAGARASERRALEVDASLARQEVKNPALVSATVGDRLAQGASAARLFAMAATASATALSLVFSADLDGERGARHAAFPLLLWGFGLVANATGLFAARGLEAQGAQPALARGAVSLAAVWLFGLLGAGYWLYPESWLWFAGVGALGLAGGALAPAAVVLRVRRQGGPLRDALDGLRAGVAPAAVSAFGFGLASAALVILVTAILGFAAAQAGALSGIPGAVRATVVVAAFAAAAWAPYAHAVEAAASLAESARRMAAVGGVEGDASQRLQRLADSQAIAGALSRCHASFAAGATALAAGLMGTPFPTEPSVVTLSNGWVPLVGAAWVLAGAAGVARRTARAARETSLEVERQLSSGPAEITAEERGPSYRGCEETAARAGISGAFTGGLGALFGPVVLGIALKVVYRGSGPRLAAEAFATFVAGAAVTALGVALTVDGARAVLTGARRANRPEGDPATYAASVTGDALSEILGNAVGPAACALSLVAAALALFATTIFR